MHIDLAAVIGEADETGMGQPASDAGVPGGAELMAFAAAAYEAKASTDLDYHRQRLQSVVGPDGLREAAATIAVFNGLVRVADGTGIQLDPTLSTVSAQSRDDLGINEYSGAANTASVDVDTAPNRSTTTTGEPEFDSVHDLFGQR